MTDNNPSPHPTAPDAPKTAVHASPAAARLALLKKRIGLAFLGVVAVAFILGLAKVAVGATVLGPVAAALLVAYGVLTLQERAMCFRVAGTVRPSPSAEDGSTRRPQTCGASVDESSGATDVEVESRPYPLKLQWLGGGLLALAGFGSAFLLMANKGQLPGGVPLGFLGVAVGTFGVLYLLGTFQEPDESVESRVTLGQLLSPLAMFIGGILLFLLMLALAHQSRGLPQPVWGALVTLSFIGTAAALFRLGVALGAISPNVDGEAKPLLRREGFWVITAAAVLYFPTMGSFSLWDPWETHYGEVAREILARNDWISLWWAQDGWFFSKPILNFWMQALFMATLGVHYQPDKMLVGNGDGSVLLHPEWVVRAPVVLLTIVAMYLLYKGVSRAFGRRAGLLGGLVLCTMPDWYFLAHQTMTDMPYVAPMASAMGLLLLGLRSDPEARVRAYEVKLGNLRLRLTAFHLVFGGILLAAMPQILYLASRNLELLIRPASAGASGFRLHLDEFTSGSAGNCGLPGNEACQATQVAAAPILESVGTVLSRLGLLGATHKGWEPLAEALFYGTMLMLLLYINWNERRVRRLYYLAAWLFAAIATMGKGPAGFALPMLCAFAYIGTTKRWKELTRLEILSGVIIIVVVALPWFTAMFARHGSPFTDRLIFHDMVNRAFKHVHDTNEGDDVSFRFYIWQLGYAMYPWTGLVPAGLIYWARRGDASDQSRGDTSVMLVMWFVFSFALFTFMGTKFHHYIFPAIPPAAMLLGIVMDDYVGKSDSGAKRLPPAYYVVMGLSAISLVLGVTNLWPGSFFGGRQAAGTFAPASPVLGWILILAGVGMFALAAKKLGKPKTVATSAAAEAVVASESAATDTDEASADLSHARVAPQVEAPTLDSRRSRHESLMLGASALSAALVLVLLGRDFVTTADGKDQPGAIRLLQLFTYNYKRPWPESLDFSAVMWGFAVITVAVSALLAVLYLRRHAATLFVCVALVWGFWGANVYMPAVSPHWGQRDIIEAYYKARSSNKEQLVAYQMNWKGENFYSGNRIPAFVSTGANFTTWLKKQREQGDKVMFFVTEHSRVNGLKNEVGGRKYDLVTDKAVCNKFLVVRVEL